MFLIYNAYFKMFDYYVLLSVVIFLGNVCRYEQHPTSFPLQNIFHGGDNKLNRKSGLNFFVQEHIWDRT